MYKLGLKQSQKYTLPHNLEISHLEFFNAKKFNPLASKCGYKQIISKELQVADL